MPGLKVTPVDTTGAGDIFHGAFTYALSKGFDIEKCVRYANITVQKIGARLSIPSYTEVSNYYNEKFPPVAGPTPSVAPQATSEVQAPVQEQTNVVQTPEVNPQPSVEVAPQVQTTPEVSNEVQTPAASTAPVDQNPSSVTVQAPQGITDATQVLPKVGIQDILNQTRQMPVINEEESNVTNQG